MAGIFSLRNWVMKQLMKPNKQGIMTIPDKGKIDFGEMLLKEQLFQKGINPGAIKNEKQLDNILNTPVVPKSEKVKPKKSGEVIEVDFDKNKNWFKGKSEGTKSLFATDKEFADELRSLRLNIIRNDPQFNLEIAESYKLPGGKTYAPYPDKEPGKLFSPTQRQNMLDEIKNLMKDDEYRSQFGGDFNFEEITDEMFRIKKARGGRTGLSYLLAEDTNERVPFKMGRRAFLKLMGGLGAGIGALKTGALKLFGKEGATVAKEVTQVPIKDIPGMPEWFKPLVNKVIREGEQVKVTEYDRLITHKTKLPNSKTDVYVNQDLNNGDVWVDIGMEKHGFPDGKFGQPVRLEYKAAEVIEPDMSKTGKVKSQGGKTKEEFNVEEAEFTGGHPENVKFEEVSVNKFGQHESNFDEVEMFATGKVKKKPRNISSLQKQDEDLADHFSNYPEPDDYASGGIARMLGE